MAQFLVRNSLNPHKVAKLGISFTKLATKEDMTGDELWLIEIGTAEPHKDGGKIAPVYLNEVAFTYLTSEVDKAVSYIAGQIDWDSIDEDDRPPLLSYISIREGVEVPIETSLGFRLSEFQPSSGIDKNSISVYVNDIDVTNELSIRGNPYEYEVSWYPRQRIRSIY